MPDSEAVPERPPDKVLRCPDCGFTTFDRKTAEAHVEYKCGESFDFVEKVP